MDPDANLKEQRELAEEILKLADGVCGDKSIETPKETKMREASEQLILYKAEKLAELVQALDQWISRGGFLPRGWKR